jgi:uncharacterized protein YcbK (DUF882 family)
MQKKIKYIIIAFVIYLIMKTKKVVPDQLTKNFHIREFSSKDGAQTPEELRSNLLELAQNLQKIRDVIDEPIYINSGYRSKLHNAKVGGVSNSYHTKGMAADIHVKGMSPEQLYTTISQMILNGSIKEGGLGLYNTFVHYDIQGKKHRWDKR